MLVIQLFIKAKGVVEIEGPHNAFGQIVKRLPAVDLDVLIQLGPQRSSDDLCGGTGHDHLPVLTIRLPTTSSLLPHATIHIIRSNGAVVGARISFLLAGFKSAWRRRGSDRSWPLGFRCCRSATVGQCRNSTSRERNRGWKSTGTRPAVSGPSPSFQ
jgi:hypothetical protein